MKTVLLLGGGFNLLTALFHLAFWKLFDWKTELPRLQVVNRGIMQALNIVLIYVILCAAALSFYLAVTPEALGGMERALLAFIGGIYLLRGAIQVPLWPAEKLGVHLGVIAVCVLAGGGYVAMAL